MRQLLINMAEIPVSKSVPLDNSANRSSGRSAVLVVISIVIILILAVGGFFVFNSIGKGNLSIIDNGCNSGELKKCDALTSTYEKEDCYESVAIKNKNICGCEKIGPGGSVMGSGMMDCYLRYALVFNDSKACNYILGANYLYKEVRFSDCKSTLAYLTKDVSGCVDIKDKAIYNSSFVPEYYADCVSSYVYASGDKNACSAIDNSYMRDDCLKVSEMPSSIDKSAIQKFL